MSTAQSYTWNPPRGSSMEASLGLGRVTAFNSLSRMIVAKTKRVQRTNTYNTHTHTHTPTFMVATIQITGIITHVIHWGVGHNWEVTGVPGYDPCQVSKSDMSQPGRDIQVVVHDANVLERCEPKSIHNGGAVMLFWNTQVMQVGKRNSPLHRIHSGEVLVSPGRASTARARALARQIGLVA